MPMTSEHAVRAYPAPPPGVCRLLLVAALSCGAGAQASDRVADVSILLDRSLDVGNNRPLVDITVCEASGVRCRKVHRVLLDTGSTGLLLKKAAWSSLPMPLHRLHAPDGPWGLCARFDGIDVWSWLGWAQVEIAGLRTLEAIPLALIDDAAQAPPACHASGSSGNLPGDINGILGVGAPRRYCLNFEGGRCPLDESSSVYYTQHASDGHWEAAQPPSSVDLPNPVAHFPYGYDDGIVLRMPALRNTRVRGGALHGELHFGVAISRDALFPPGALAEIPADFDTHVAGVLTVGAGRYEGLLAIDSGAAHIALPHRLICLEGDCGQPPGHRIEAVAACVEFGAVESWAQVEGGVAPNVAAHPPDFGLALADLHTLAEISGDWAACDAAANLEEQDLPVLGMPFLFGRTVAIGIGGSMAPSGRVYERGYLLMADNPPRPARASR